MVEALGLPPKPSKLGPTCQNILIVTLSETSLEARLGPLSVAIKYVKPPIINKIRNFLLQYRREFRVCGGELEEVRVLK